ncbi:glycosyltransferase family protein [Cellulomonas triticagri]|uniref:glycosyltransferase family protein n=1 Tax=Cellulomonas triticagri TaxID=2483352 RepID=UPI001F34EA44|nr:glycosyltransferase [Cellulomonas triticagri]
MAGWRRWRARQRPPGAERGDVRAQRGRDGLTFPELAVPGAPLRRGDLRVAVVLDDFSRLALGFEWQQVEVRPTDWRATLEREPVDLLFVESAWHGNDGAWRYHLAGDSAPRPELAALVSWCHERGIPTVFWNKEDPAHYADFLASARLFDHVFTTDADRLPDYRRDLGHDRVDVLPFAAQPALHHPVRHGDGHHERDIAFAGMYFAHRHPERRAQMDLLLGAALRAGSRMTTGLEIFSRQLGGDARYQFPEPYASRVVGSLTYPRMLTAYRAYKVFLNVNTVVGSPTMCARRIFEITASGTPVVSTPSPAVSAVFGADEVVQVAGPDEAEHALRALARNAELRDRMVHRAQRRIWAGHTYSHRVDAVLRAVGRADATVTGTRPRVSALVATRRPGQLDHVLRTLGQQTDVDLQVVLLAHGVDLPAAEVRARAADRGLTDVVVLAAPAEVPLGACLNLLADAADGDLLAKIDDDDLYGPAYLADQAAALAYSRAEVVGKQAHYLHLRGPGVTVLRSPGREHRFGDRVSGPTIVARREVLRSTPFPARPRGEDTGFLDAVVAAGGRVYSADRFNFVQVRAAGGAAHTWTATDTELLASGDVQVVGPDPFPHVLV